MLYNRLVLPAKIHAKIAYFGFFRVRSINNSASHEENTNLGDFSYEFPSSYETEVNPTIWFFTIASQSGRASQEENTNLGDFSYEFPSSHETNVNPTFYLVLYDCFAIGVELYTKKTPI